MEEERGYKYDVFISYPHGENDEQVAEWVTEIFLSDFTQYLRNSLGLTPEVYIDVEANKPGDKWKPKLLDALARTKIMVAIWSINYFESEYCRGECAVMLHREKELGYSTGGRQGSLIVPIRLWDGDSYPAIAREFHQLMCEEYSGVRQRTEGHDRLREVISSWVPDVALRIDAAPPWDPTWLTSEWLHEPIRKSEECKELWPPKKVYRLENMGGDNG